MTVAAELGVLARSTPSPRALTVALVISVIVATAARLSAESGTTPTDTKRVRMMSPILNDAFEAGLRQSGTLRDLVKRLEQSDLIVYVTPLLLENHHLGGEMQFVAATPESRYLRVSVKQQLPEAQLIAMIGHELQHCVEIAQSPQVVDSKTLQTLYRSIGFIGRLGGHETEMAKYVGTRVLRELRSPTPTRQTAQAPTPSPDSSKR